jgi:hypothetical protein
VPAQAGEGMVEAMSRYSANVTRDGRFWLIHVPEVDRYTQARHLREVTTMARDLISVMTGEATEAIELDVHISRPASVDEHLARAAQLRDESQRAQAAAAAELRQAARELRDAGMPLRDIGQLLDVSYQRAHQLVS